MGQRLNPRKPISGSLSVLLALSLALAGCEDLCVGKEHANKLGTALGNESFTAPIQKRGRFYGFYLVAVGCDFSEDEAVARECFPSSASVEIADQTGAVVLKQEIGAGDYFFAGWHAPSATAALGWRATPEELKRFEEDSLNPADLALENGGRYTLRLQTASWPSSARGKGFEVYERYNARPWFCRR